MAGRLDGKVAIVTGASNGIGRATALLFAKNGAAVVCSDLEPSTRLGQLTPTHEEIIKLNGKSKFFKADVRSEMEVAALVDDTVKTFGRLDIMFNNAGISADLSGPQSIWDYDESRWDERMDINSKGPFLGCKHATRVMKEQAPWPSGDRGWIVNMSSILGLVARPNQVAYTASKHAVVGLTKAAAVECGPHRIHVNAVCPGFIATDMTSRTRNDEEKAAEAISQHPFKGFGEAEDIARAVLFLCSPDNSYITGAIIPVDGGYLCL